jgi:hypothetical protein
LFGLPGDPSLQILFFGARPKLTIVPRQLAYPLLNFLMTQSGNMDRVSRK